MVAVTNRNMNTRKTENDMTQNDLFCFLCSYDKYKVLPALISYVKPLCIEFAEQNQKSLILECLTEAEAVSRKAKKPVTIAPLLRNMEHKDVQGIAGHIGLFGTDVVAMVGSNDGAIAYNAAYAVGKAAYCE